MSTCRSDGLDNPLSPNSSRLTWSEVARRCEESPAVAGHSHDSDGMHVAWTDGTDDDFSDPLAALEAIRAMEAT